MDYFNNIYYNKKILVTGHTGFKGSWLTLWLTKLGAKVTGYSLDPPTEPSHWELIKLNIENIKGDIRDKYLLNKIIIEKQPDLVFHLAAQSLVGMSYIDPYITYETNVLGTLNLLECCRANGVKSIIIVTSDKCYENKEWIWGYKETDPMGGYDPYSSSKGCTELLVSSYRQSFFNQQSYLKNHNTLLASVRAGNVIGGGDWAKDRLVPDLMKAAAEKKITVIRSPDAIRPWQHVLDPLSGYLLLGQKLMEREADYVGAWNFGPEANSFVTVRSVVDTLKDIWDSIDVEYIENNEFHEAQLLKLDCTKSHYYLKWQCVWETPVAIQKTVNWYRGYYQNGDCRSIDDIIEFENDATRTKAIWVT